MKQNEKANYYVSNNVRKYRVFQNLTKERLALKSEISVQRIRSIEKGTENPTVKTLGKLANALGVNIQELFEPSFEYRIKGDVKEIDGQRCISYSILYGDVIVPDVSTKLFQIRDFVKKINEIELDPIHLYDAVYDFIERD